jgi:hypothetical protein
MSKVIPIDRDARARAALNARQRRLEKDLERLAKRAGTWRQDLLGEVAVYTWRLVQFVPPGRRAELARSLDYIGGELRLSNANLKTLYDMPDGA